jgi:hypothetical protein
MLGQAQISALTAQVIAQLWERNMRSTAIFLCLGSKYANGHEATVVAGNLSIDTTVLDYGYEFINFSSGLWLRIHNFTSDW